MGTGSCSWIMQCPLHVQYSQNDVAKQTNRVLIEQVIWSVWGLAGCVLWGGWNGSHGRGCYTVDVGVFFSHRRDKRGHVYWQACWRAVCTSMPLSSAFLDWLSLLSRSLSLPHSHSFSRSPPLPQFSGLKCMNVISCADTLKKQASLRYSVPVQMRGSFPYLATKVGLSSRKPHNWMICKRDCDDFRKAKRGATRVWLNIQGICHEV